MAGNQRVDAFAAWILSCRPSWYNLWVGGPLSDRSPSWAANLPLPTPAEVNNEGLFCAAVGNLGRRFYELPIPNPHDDENWDGGTLAWYDYYYHDARVEWFDPNKDYADGYAFVSQYVSPSSQGHWAMSYEGYCIESITNGGLVWSFTIAESHDWGHYVLAIPPEVWLGPEETPEPPQPPPAPTPQSKVFDTQMLINAMTSDSFDSPNIDPAWAEEYHGALLKIFRDYEIKTRERITAFLAQVGHESGSFNWWREFGGSGKHYAPFFGRGPIQLTWSYNYEEFANETGHDALNWPDIVASTTQIGFDAAGWFWRGKSVPRLGGDPVGDLNPWADIATWESFDWITEAINGGFNGKADRDARYAHAWNVIPAGVELPGDAPVPEPEPEPEPDPDPEPVPGPDPVPDPDPIDGILEDFWIGFTDDGWQWMRAATGQGGDAPKGAYIKATQDGGRYWLEIVPPKPKPKKQEDVFSGDLGDAVAHSVKMNLTGEVEFTDKEKKNG